MEYLYAAFATLCLFFTIACAANAAVLPKIDRLDIYIGLVMAFGFIASFKHYLAC